MKDFVYSVTSLVFCLIMLFQSEMMYGSECSDRFSNTSLEKLEELFIKASPYSKPVFIRQSLIKKSELFKPFWTSYEKPIISIFKIPPFQVALGITDDMLTRLSLVDDSGSKTDLRMMTEVYRFIHEAINFYELKYIYYPNSTYTKAVQLIFNIITSDALIDSYQQNKLRRLGLYKNDIDIYGFDDEFNELEELFVKEPSLSVDVLQHIYGNEFKNKLDKAFKNVVWSLGSYLYLHNKRTINTRIQRVNILPPLFGSFGIMLSSNTVLVSASIIERMHTENIDKFDDRLSVLKKDYLTNALRTYFIYDNLHREKFALLRFSEGTFDDEKHLQLVSYLGISDLVLDETSSNIKKDSSRNRGVMTIKDLLQEIKRIMSLDSRLKIEGLEGLVSK